MDLMDGNGAGGFLPIMTTINVTTPLRYLISPPDQGRHFLIAHLCVASLSRLDLHLMTVLLPFALLHLSP